MKSTTRIAVLALFLTSAASGIALEVDRAAEPPFGFNDPESGNAYRPLSSERGEEVGPDLMALVEEIAAVFAVNVYNPRELETDAYMSIQEQLRTVARQSKSIEDFVSEFNAIWRVGPFSHVNLVVAQLSAAETADYVDTMNVGGSGASLEWNGGIAVLAVTTMMGLDTIDQIRDAYQELGQRGAQALVVDLRDNVGGAFAVRPLVGHLVPTTMEVGAFVSQSWFEGHLEAPSEISVGRVAPWTGWSLKSFWTDVSSQPITRIQLRPSSPRYTGPVYVLTSRKTASAAELAVDALGRLENVTVVGEPTAGKMLSQRMFDLSLGLQVFLPIADYYSSVSGRIEGLGLAPDIEVEADSALIVALEMAKREPLP